MQQIRDFLDIRVKVVRNQGAKTEVIQISTNEQTFSEFKRKIQMLIQGQVSQITWMGKPLEIKKDDNTQMKRYLEKFLNGHPNGMTAEDLERQELEVAMQAIGGGKGY